ncbi:MAG: hypothetical protein ABI824_06815 [Acidobacteriota bacterium]
MRTTIRFGELRRVFRSHANSMADAHIARLCVLYEDLRLELQGVLGHAISSPETLGSSPLGARLDGNDSYRNYYFLRRSVGTLFEFAEGIHLLNSDPDFLKIELGEALSSEWLESVDFFDSKFDLIQKVRNDIGGHFGSVASRYAVKNLREGAAGKLELLLDDKDGRIELRLHFAGDIAATALLKHLEGETDDERVSGFFQNVLVVAYKHATKAVQILVGVHLLPKLGL